MNEMKKKNDEDDRINRNIRTRGGGREEDDDEELIRLNNDQFKPLLQQAGLASHLSLSLPNEGQSKIKEEEFLRFSRYSTLPSLVSTIKPEDYDYGVIISLCRVLLKNVLEIKERITQETVEYAKNNQYDAIHSSFNEEYALLNPSFLLPEFLIHVSFDSINMMEPEKKKKKIVKKKKSEIKMKLKNKNDNSENDDYKFEEDVNGINEEDDEIEVEELDDDNENNLLIDCPSLLKLPLEYFFNLENNLNECNSAEELLIQCYQMTLERNNDQNFDYYSFLNENSTTSSTSLDVQIKQEALEDIEKVLDNAHNDILDMKKNFLLEITSFAENSNNN